MSGPGKYLVRVEETITTRTTRIIEIDISAQSADHARRLAEKTYPYFLPLYVPRVLKDQEDEIKDLRFDAFSADDADDEPRIIDVQPAHTPKPPPRLLAAPPKTQAAPGTNAQKYKKRTLERLRKAERGAALRLRQGDDLLIYGLVKMTWNGGKTLYEITEKGRAALAEVPS